MPRFLRIQDTMIHVPSVSSVTIGTTCFSYPYLNISFHCRKDIRITYGPWDSCEADFRRLRAAVKEIEDLLGDLPLTEELGKAKMVVESNALTQASIDKTREHIEKLQGAIKELQTSPSSVTANKNVSDRTEQLECAIGMDKIEREMIELGDGIKSMEIAIQNEIVNGSKKD